MRGVRCGSIFLDVQQRGNEPIRNNSLRGRSIWRHPSPAARGCPSGIAAVHGLARRSVARRRGRCSGLAASSDRAARRSPSRAAGRAPRGTPCCELPWQPQQHVRPPGFAGVDRVERIRPGPARCPRHCRRCHVLRLAGTRGGRSWRGRRARNIAGSACRDATTRHAPCPAGPDSIRKRLSFTASDCKAMARRAESKSKRLTINSLGAAAGGSVDTAARLAAVPAIPNGRAAEFAAGRGFAADELAQAAGARLHRLGRLVCAGRSVLRQGKPSHGAGHQPPRSKRTDPGCNELLHAASFSRRTPLGQKTVADRAGASVLLLGLGASLRVVGHWRRLVVAQAAFHRA